MIFQGIAWVDQSDFRIVRLRTDLLAPRLEISIQRQTADILFGPVPIPTIAFTLWLPQMVHVEMETRGQILEENNISIRSTVCTRRKASRVVPK